MKLRELAKAYANANENDYCTDKYPECEGLRPDEIVNKIILEIYKKEPEEQEIARLEQEKTECCGNDGLSPQYRLEIKSLVPEKLIEIRDGKDKTLVDIEHDGTVNIYNEGSDKEAAKKFYECLQFEGKTLHEEIARLEDTIKRIVHDKNEEYENLLEQYTILSEVRGNEIDGYISEIARLEKELAQEKEFRIHDGMQKVLKDETLYLNRAKRAEKENARIKGISVEDWAKECGVCLHTDSNWIGTMTKQTINRLAKQIHSLIQGGGK